MAMSTNMYRVLSFDKQLNTGVAETWQVSISAVAKCNTTDVPYALANEYVCGELGRFLGLPVPPCGLLQAPNHAVTRWFASLDFNLAGNSLPPVDPQACWQNLPDLCTGLLLFNALVANADRHAANLSADALARPTKMAIFDHSHALFGVFQPGAEQRFSELRDRLGLSGGSRTAGNRHCLLDVISTDDHFEKWLDRLGALPAFLIDDLCEVTQDLGATAAEAAAASGFLKHRVMNLRHIIEHNRAEFSAINQWSLFP
jgi:hypothetical protein